MWVKRPATSALPSLLFTLADRRFSNSESELPKKGVIMPTETEPTTATSQKTNEGDKSSQPTGLTQQTRPSAIARNLRPSVLGLSLSPFEMFRLIFSSPPNGRRV